MEYDVKNIPSKIRYSNKTEPLPILIRFFKEMKCWPFFKDKILNSDRYKNDEKYKFLYHDYDFSGGVNGFLKRYLDGPEFLLTARSKLVFEYDDIGEKFMEVLQEKYRELLHEKGDFLREKHKNIKK